MDAKYTRRSAILAGGAAFAIPAIHSNNLESGPMPFTPKFVDLVRNITSVTGTGPVPLGQPVSGYTSLASAVSPGDQFYYCIQSVDKAAEREVGRGTMLADGRVARQPVFGPATNFTSGAKTIALVAAAEWFSKLDGSMPSVASRAELAARDGASTGRAFLGESGRAGNFAFDPANLSGKVSADPAQAIYVPSQSDPSGASGAWVRAFDGPVNVRWFGATGDGTSNDGPAFAAALALLKSLSMGGHGYSKGGSTLFIPAGHYYLAGTTLDVSHTLIIEGENCGDAAGSASVLRWAANTTGIRIQSANTVGAAGVQAPGPSRGAASLIRNLMLIGGYAGSDAEFHGIHLRGTATIRDVYIEGFAGDGIHAVAAVGAGGAEEGNANSIYAERVYIENCRNGLFLDGADVNAGTFTSINVKNARQWGIYDSSFLANTHVGHHASGCGAGPYKSDNPNAPIVWLGCYSESGQPASSILSPATVIGGLHGAGINGTAVILAAHGKAIDTSGYANDSFLNRTRVTFNTATGDTLEIHNKAAFGGGIQSRIGFSQGFEADGVTPAKLGALFAYSNTSILANAEGMIGFGVRQYGTGNIVERMQLCEAAQALRPSDDNLLSLGDAGQKWKELHVGSANGIKVDGVKVIGGRGAALPADATDLASAIALLNAIKARMIAHGLVAA